MNERQREVRAHYKKPLITVIHDLGRPAGVPRQIVQSRSRYSSRRATVGNGSDDESKKKSRERAIQQLVAGWPYSPGMRRPTLRSPYNEFSPWIATETLRNIAKEN